MDGSMSSVASSDEHPHTSVRTSIARERAADEREEEAKKVKAMESTLALQERMITTLEGDNKRLLSDNKKLREQVKALRDQGGRFNASMETSTPRVDEQRAQPSSSAPPQPAGPPAAHAAAVRADEQPARSPWHHEPGDDRAMVPKSVMTAEIDRLTRTHDAEVQDMARKVAWYVDHQEFNRAQNALVAEQQAAIHDLRAKVMELEMATSGRAGSSAAGPQAQKDKQLRLLRQRVAELEEDRRNANPNSLTELIRACRPPVSEQQAYKALQVRLDEAETKAKEAEEHYQRILDQLRVDSDTLRLQYQAKLDRLEEELRRRLVETQTRKVKELEKSLADTRKASHEKIKALEQANLALRRGVPAAPAPRRRSPSPPRVGGANSSNDAGESHEALNMSNPSQHDSRPPRAPRSAADDAAEYYGGGGGGVPHGVPKVELQATQRALDRVETENEELRRQIRSLQGELSRIVSSRGAPDSPDVAASLQAQVSHLEQDAALHRRLLREAQDSLRTAHAQFEERMYQTRADMERKLEAARRQHVTEMEELRAEHSATMRRAVAAASAGQHSAQLRDILASGDFTRRDARKYLLLVAERLDVIERQEQARAAEHSYIINEARRVAESELAIERQRMDLELRRKDQQITEFQLQLDGLLAEIAALTPVGPPPASSGLQHATKSEAGVRASPGKAG